MKCFAWAARARAHAACLESAPRSGEKSASSAILALAHAGRHAEVLELFCRMRRDGLPVSKFMLPSVLKACARLQDSGTLRAAHAVVARAPCAGMSSWPPRCGVAACAHLADIDSGSAFHGYLIRRVLDTDAIRGSALVDMYGKCGLMEHARLVFDRMDERNYVAWDALLSGYVENGQVDLALKVFRQKESANIKPNQHTFVNLLKLCGNRRYTEYGRQIHAHTIKVIHQMNVVLETELIDMYAKCGCIEVARLLFVRMNERNLISWNALLSGYVGMDSQVHR
ncbi:hypothetical protein ZWY2020_005798 [Hordeum vulgare]|nr:hypothetical protein ZWY2020_005798 [Hordeum vulgare]